ncbi:sperm-associated antigen 17-like [Xenia sp. Carnegie-2017]|uniref:sperm-associated antigen 17-like n=1 Tax=Xenia sp. Carnegie-2017 TaxID=2897299 RepID=UPI001F04C376|nr:sperm-associated antigen 17-like [Xenia sp. Carnegie-2017]
MQHEVLSSDVTSSKTSCDNHDNLSNVIMGGKPGALPNSQIAAGMTRKLDIEMFAVAVGVSGESGVGSVGHHIEIIGENEIFYLPVSATILTAYEYDNRSNSFPQGYLSKGTRMIDNRPPSRDAIRPRRNHMYSDVSKQF